MKNDSCPLCEGPQLTPAFKKRTGEHYLKCQDCSLIFLEASFHLATQLEKEQYDLHENEVQDLRYQNFMEPLITEVLNSTPGQRGLDFGCGPTSVLRHLLAPQGFDVSLFDKFYYPETKSLEKKYDFIFASEVVEHLHWPKEEFQLFRKLMEDDGVLVIGTSLYDGVEDLSKWSYAMDPTHISLYSRDTFRWISRNMGYEAPQFFSRRGILLRKALKQG